MLIGIISDIHDNIPNLEKALSIFADHNIKTIIFCGDFCSPIPLRALGPYDGDVHAVFGNADGDPFLTLKIAYSDYPNIKLHGQHAELEFGDVKIAVTHYPLYGKALASTGDYDAVFSGDTHVWHEEKIGKCLWLNPGEIMGWKGPATCAIYDTSTNNAEKITF